MESFVPHLNFLKPNVRQLLSLLIAWGGLAVIAAACLLNSSGKITVDNPDGSRTTMNISSLKDVHLIDLKTGRPASFIPKRPNSLLVFMSPVDCPSCLEEVRVWQTLSNSYGNSNLEVVGILVNTSIAESQAFIKAYQPSFTLYLDDQNQIDRYVGLPQKTPFKSLINSQGKVLLAEGPKNVAMEQQAFGAKVVELLNSTKSPH